MDPKTSKHTRTQILSMLLAFMGLTAAFSPLAGQAISADWVGPGNGNLTDLANWEVGGSPASRLPDLAGDAANIGAGSSVILPNASEWDWFSVVNVVNSTMSVSAVNIPRGGNYNLSGVTFRLTAATTNGSYGDTETTLFNVGSGGLTINNQTTLSWRMRMQLSGEGGVTINNSSNGITAYQEGSYSYLGDTLIQAGRLSLSGGALAFSFRDGGDSINKIHGAGGSSRLTIDSGGTLLFNLAGFDSNQTIEREWLILDWSSFGHSNNGFQQSDYFIGSDGETPWTLVDPDANPFRTNIADSGRVWTYEDGQQQWQFTEASGILSVTIIPEPSSALSSAPARKSAGTAPILPPDWDPVQAANRVMNGLIRAHGPEIKMAHDPDMVIVGDYAYIVSFYDNKAETESAGVASIYNALSIVNIRTQEVEDFIPISHSEKEFENETLPVGASFVTRIVQKDGQTLRVFFSHRGDRHTETWSDGSRKVPDQMYYLDFDIPTRTFDRSIYRPRLGTIAGDYPFQAGYFYFDAVAHGFTKRRAGGSFYLIDSFKHFDGDTYAILNNYSSKQLALSKLNKELDRFEIIGHMNEPQDRDLSEASVNRLPDGSWMAIIRTNDGDLNYMFNTSPDGKNWGTAAPREFLQTGASSKPTFDRFSNGIYYLGWTDRETITRRRDIFNIDVSRDGVHWERKYRFETPDRGTFQSPVLREQNGVIYILPVMGVKERIMFGKLEAL